MVGFRNVLVHQYEEVADEVVLSRAEDPADFWRFRQEILAYARRQGGSEAPPAGGAPQGIGGPP